MPLSTDQDAPDAAGGNARFGCNLPAQRLQMGGPDREQLSGYGWCWAGAWAFVLHGPISRCWVG